MSIEWKYIIDRNALLWYDKFVRYRQFQQRKELYL